MNQLFLAYQQVLEALGQLEFPYIYPDPESRRLRAALAKDSGLEAEHILVGCGADELIDLIMRYNQFEFWVLVEKMSVHVNFKQ